MRRHSYISGISESRKHGITHSPMSSLQLSHIGNEILYFEIIVDCHEVVVVCTLYPVFPNGNISHYGVIKKKGRMLTLIKPTDILQIFIVWFIFVCVHTHIHMCVLSTIQFFHRYRFLCISLKSRYRTVSSLEGSFCCAFITVPPSLSPSDCSHYSECEIISHCGFDLYIFFGEISTQIIYSFLKIG